MASRPLDTVKVMDAPTVNNADLELPVVTLMPAGFDVTVTPLRPLADTVRVASGGGGGGAAVTVTVAVRVIPAYVAEIVAVVSWNTLVVVTVKPRGGRARRHRHAGRDADDGRVAARQRDDRVGVRSWPDSDHERGGGRTTRHARRAGRHALQARGGRCRRASPSASPSGSSRCTSP